MNRTAQPVYETVVELAREHLGWERELPPSSRLAADLCLDSLQRMTLAIEIENHFQICLEPEDEERVESIADLVDVIERKLAAGEGAGA